MSGCPIIQNELMGTLNESGKAVVCSYIGFMQGAKAYAVEFGMVSMLVGAEQVLLEEMTQSRLLQPDPHLANSWMMRFI